VSEERELGSRWLKKVRPLASALSETFNFNFQLSTFNFFPSLMDGFRSPMDGLVEESILKKPNDLMVLPGAKLNMDQCL
jgi:hypothetical protein